MRILFTIPHFFNSEAEGKHGSQRKNFQPRLRALSAGITALHQLFGDSQRIIDHGQRLALPVNQPRGCEVDIVICTTRNCHLLSHFLLLKHLYKHQVIQVNPLLLGFECQAILRDCLGQYDYYCYLEDDLIVRDPWLFIKLNWFSQQVGNVCLLQPNRYEVSTQGPIYKAYIDGNLAPQVTAPFQNIQEQALLKGEVLKVPITFHRPSNPHSGCYFLNAEQMAYWVKQPYFLDRDTSFIGPLESAATLGIMKTFQVYKAAPEQADFLEVQHFGTQYLKLIGERGRLL
ncbi:MAG: calcium-binding protein [Cyanophyceae cyanobacterium]